MEPIKLLDKSERNRLTAVYTKVENQLDEWGREFNEDVSVKTMLQKLQISEEDYINAIRTTIRRPTVLLQRAPKEAFVNAYNKDLLLTWKANVDIQFVLDGYTCAKYVVQYISKAGGGVSILLQAVAADVRDGTTRAQDKLQKFASVFVSGSELSAQEAAALCL